MELIKIDINTKEKYIFEDLLLLENVTEQCGLKRKEFSLKSEYGSGKLVSCNFNGITVKLVQVKFNNTIQFNGFQEVNALVFSALASGEKKIIIPESDVEIVQENNESYISYFNKVEGTMTYAKDKYVEEIIVKMSPDFIQKHELDVLFPIFDEYATNRIAKNLMQQIETKSQSIIREIIEDDRVGLLKRLFIESKVLEILSIQIHTKNKRKTNNNTTIKKVYEAKNLITENLDTQLSIKELSKKVYLNEFILKKEFKRIFDITIFEFSLKTRMDEAKKLLIHTSKPIYEIAELVGYKNSTHFSAAFKRKENITPKEFRKTLI